MSHFGLARFCGVHATVACMTARYTSHSRDRRLTTSTDQRQIASIRPGATSTSLDVSAFQPMAKAIARRLKQHEFFAGMDAADIAQDLVTRLHEVSTKYDATRAWAPKFAEVVLANAATSIARKQLTGRERFRRQMVSLNDVSGASLVAEHPWESIDTRIDVTALREDLDADLQQTCRAIVDRSVRKAAKVIGVAPSTIQRRKRRVRAVCERRGLE